jgi:hypothetical protein
MEFIMEWRNGVLSAETRRSGERRLKTTWPAPFDRAKTLVFTPLLRASALGFGLFVWLSFSLDAQTTPCDNTPAWSPCELVFELDGQAAAAHANPYASVELRAEFRSPQFRTTSIPGYWDGARRMVLRFTPTEPGHWEYRLTSNVTAWDGKQGSFTAAESESAGFIQAANVHHWASVAHNQPHLWMAASEPGMAFLDDAAFRAMVDERAAQKFTHLHGLMLGDGAAAGGFLSADHPDLGHFQRLDERIRYLNQKGITADLTIASNPAVLSRLFPTPAARRRLMAFLVGRYAAMNVTWQAVASFEDYAGGRALLKELGGCLKEMDGYHHPRSAGAHVTSAPLLDDGWMDFASYGTPDPAVGAIEHQLYQAPAVNQLAAPSGSGDAGDVTFRHQLWNATVNGQYPDAAVSGAATAKAMTVWFDFMSATRHWDLEPYFDLDGGRALALPGVEYIVYVEKPGPVELTVEHHGYEVFWVDPADGTSTLRQKYSGEHFTGEPPDRFHDWVLHVVREGTIESMNRSYKFESRNVPVQEIVINPEKIPFDIERPAGDLTAGQPVPFSARMKRATRATRTMLWMWTGEVTAEGRGYRVLATGQQGSFTVPPGLSEDYPTDMLVRLYGMNGYGTVYMAVKGYTLKQ